MFLKGSVVIIDNILHLFEIVGNLTKTRLKYSLEKYVFEKKVCFNGFVRRDFNAIYGLAFINPDAS